MNARPPIKALIVVDLQHDFVDGSLAVPSARAIVPIVNRIRDLFEFVVFTKDWHPASHGSFALNHPGKRIFESVALAGLPQILWPVHCVQGERGAELVSEVNTAGADIILKGTDPKIDSYSAFADNGHLRSTGLDRLLKNRRVTDVFVCGLATDYCVKATALDAVQLGFRTHLIEDACRGVDRQPGDIEKALDEMRAAGIQMTDSQQIASAFSQCR